MKGTSRLLALALAGALTIGVGAGCGGSDDGDSSEATTTVVETAGTTDTPAEPVATREDFEQYAMELLPTIDAAIARAETDDPADGATATKELAAGLRKYADQLDANWPDGTSGAVGGLRSEALALALSAEGIAEDPNQFAASDFALSAELFAEEMEKARNSFPSETEPEPTAPASGTDTDRPFPMEEPHIENYELGYIICGPDLGTPEENRREFGLPPGASLADIADAYADAYKDEFANAAWQGCFDGLSGSPSRI